MKNKGQIKDGKYYYKYWSLLIFLVIPVLFLAKYYLAGQVPGDADLIQFFSEKKAFAQMLLKGEIPQWNPYLQNGMPQMLGSSLYIANFLLAFLPLKQFIYAFYIVHLMIAGTFFFLFLKENNSSFPIAYIYAIIFECSIQINGLRKSHPAVISAICLFTVVMFATKRYFVVQKKRWLCISALLSGLIMIVAQQYGTYAVMVLFIYIVANCIRIKLSITQIIKKAMIWLGGYIGSILYAILPNLMMIREYSSYGSSQTSYDTFRSFSMHPIKLIEMIYPEFFGEKYQAMGVNYSSEMDIEVYLGIFVLFMAVYGGVKLYKTFDVALGIGCVIFALIYACVAHIPIINKIVYHIPILGSFRASGRMLFVFCFFMIYLSAMGTSEFLKENSIKDISFIRNLSKKLLVTTIILIVAAILSVCLIVAPEQQSAYFVQIQRAFMTPLIVSAAGVLVCLILLRISNGEKLQKRKLIYGLFLFSITLYEILPYSMATTPIDYNSGTSQEAVVENLQKNIAQYKVYDAFGNVDGAHMSIISQNRNMIRKIASINSYTAYNNPLLCKYLKNLGRQVTDIPFNYSGLLTGSLDNTNNVLIQNDLLSMLGVKYVIDSEGVIEKNNGMIYCDESPMETCSIAQCLEISHQSGSAGVYEFPLSQISEKECYKVVITLTEEQRKNTTYLATDLYGGPEYDRSTEEKRFEVTENQNQYTAYLYAQDTELATENIRLRIQAASDSEENTLYKAEVFKVTPIEGYRYWDKTREGTVIYENVNARSLLYVPEMVETKKNFDDIYLNCDNYSLDKIAYVNAEHMDQQNSNAQIKIKEQTYNTMEATIAADTDTFLCFSQNYSKNWKAYVDGRKQTIHMVNGLIMGIKVSEGNHEIRFVYHDNSYVVGFSITIITYVSLFVAYFVVRFKRKGACVNEERRYIES